MKRLLLMVVNLLLFLAMVTADDARDAKMAPLPGSDKCLSCHASVSPGITMTWRQSSHAHEGIRDHLRGMPSRAAW